MAERIRIKGLVQGVGFRPTVWRVAQACGLRGTVCNDGWGVLIEAEGDMEAFLQALTKQLPPLAHIDAIEREALSHTLNANSFEIIHSQQSAAHTHIVPDAATCLDCLAEINDPHNRRYRYAFTNCTHCGPRLSIVTGIPYDRAQTTMQVFSLCDACHAEYDNPQDRRFHAQPNACADCGCELWLEQQGEIVARNFTALQAAAQALQQGKIIAIKGIGGIHLAVDASNAEAVALLRERKHRPAKPLALMAKTIEQIQQYCFVSEQELQALQSSAAPIVVLEKRIDGNLPENLAPQQHHLGFMLPYTPLHHLLMAELEHPIVLTSGNRSGNPQCIHNAQSRSDLAEIADLQLLHNREIANRVDDSVVRWMAEEVRVLRRARGYAPAPLKLSHEFTAAPELLALGTELKNSFALLREGEVILSQHIGDLDNYATYRDFQHQLALYQHLYQTQPQAVVIDAHPHYKASHWGREWAEQHALQRFEVQHHHAHLAACLAENQYPLSGKKVLGIILDGTGYGTDGTLWGGEFLLGNYLTFERLTHFATVPLLGGTQAILQPWRIAYAHLKALGWEDVCQQYGDLEIIHYLQHKPLATLDRMQAQGVNSPSTSSCGRLFDAVAAVLGLCREQVTYEGQAAIALEALAGISFKEPLPTSSSQGKNTKLLTSSLNKGSVGVGLSMLWFALLDDLKNGLDKAHIAARFHLNLVDLLVQTVTDLAQTHNFQTVALSGGVFQNRFLLEQLQTRLQALFHVLTHRLVPMNDGGIALGQAAIGAARIIQEQTACV
ncbi:carbamoyltransferase HypF [Thiolinea disciformis]|uniref:carbamoyltransferase HypF n=1 Tax=Thiolinea disciformis TaxID=125614 RepID=UPI00035E3D1B|nr:carbamoyltransferase HypF [Thiolinea disciformis]